MSDDFWTMPEAPMGEIDNPAHPHLPCAIICDVSGSMAPYMQTLNESLVELLQTVFHDNTARGRVDISIFAYDHQVKMVTPFQCMWDYHDSGYAIPRLRTRKGLTGTYEAMRRALEAVDERRAAYRAHSTPRYHPVFFLLTDGWATDKPKDGRRTAFDDLLDKQIHNHWGYVPIALGDDCDIEDLARYQKDHQVIHIETNKKDNEKTLQSICEVFKAMSRSLIQIGHSKSGEAVYYAVLGQYTHIELNGS